MSQNTEALQGAQMEMNDLRRQIQTLEIELASQQNLVMLHGLQHCPFINPFNRHFPFNNYHYKYI